MLGALIGDIVGSVFERAPHKSKEFDFVSERSRFTDDSVLTVATADALLHGYDYMQVFKYWGRSYPNAGYGQKFFRWCLSDSDERGESYGNGSAMRVSPIGWAFDSLEEVLEEAKRSAEPSHSHPEGVKGACAVAASVFLARSGKSKDEIKDYVAREFGYDLDRSLESVRPGYIFDSSCQGSVPEALIAFLESESFEDALSNAVSLGGDSDTQACLAGAVAEAFYGPVSKRWVTLLNILMPQEAVKVADEFNKKYLDSRYNFFCCGHESADGRPAEKGMPYDLQKLDPGNCRWWVKDLGMQDEVWAFVTESETPHEASVYFSTDTPVIFDQLCFKSFEDAFIALNRNGFDLFLENYYEGGFGGYASSPRGRFRIEPHPIFSSGKHWI
ncbi:ADP-ribosylglycohydrolase family protein [Cloacibacillus evryensis]|uniref:ADP-ribosylglycohydrolase family protein n=1 Tax=Cloacibacillus evryensis TaxID=508460 RepID=UPI002671A55D|nr:ADP-ribosylglycohydrolase family protein [Cloacibacillus evryensis]